MTTEKTPTTDEAMVRRFPTMEEMDARRERIEQTTDIVTDAGRVADEIGPRDRHPERRPETVPSVSAILIAAAILTLAEAVREAGRRRDE